MTSNLSNYGQSEAWIKNSPELAVGKNELADFVARTFPAVDSEIAAIPSMDYDSQNSFEKLFQNRLDKTTPEEFDLAQTLLSVAMQVASALHTKPFLPKHSLIDTLAIQRTLNSIYGIENPPILLEFGNSQGLNSAANNLIGGSSYIAELSQPHFILQDLFLNKLREYKKLSASSIQIPWWDWNLKSEQYSADVILINDSLLLFSDNLILSTLRSFKRILQNSSSSKAPLLLCYLTKEESFLSWSKLWQLAGQVGFQILDLGSSQTVLIPDFASELGQKVWVKLKKPFIDPLDLIVPLEHYESLVLALENI